ncbi:unnamed protein product, partial [Gongylonema pulchrum]|uniref:BIR51 protein n=1 Tax=Gongylonema pulchrum TaxID=637853 RepID=A0A183EHA7_9BILA
MACLDSLLDGSVDWQFFYYDARLASFTDEWPHRSANLLPEKMAAAGFYYDPDNTVRDNVTCPFCLKSLMGWEFDDDPVVEHSKRKDLCYFARLQKEEEEWT